MRTSKSVLLMALSLALLTPVDCLAREHQVASSDAPPFPLSPARESVLPAAEPEWAKLLDKAVVAHDQNKFDQAKTFAKQALDLLQSGGKRNRDLTAAMEIVGSYYYEAGDYKDAEGMYERAMEINIALFSRKSREVVSNLNMLGRIKRHEGNLAESLTLAQEAYDTASVLSDSRMPDEATLIHNLGRIYEEQKNYDRAKECYTKALTITQDKLKADTSAYSTYCQNLGTAYLKTGELDKAKALIDSSLKLRETLGIANDKNIAITKANLAKVAIEQGDDEKGKELLKSAIGIMSKGTDPNKQHLASYMDSYGQLLEKMNGQAKPALSPAESVIPAKSQSATTTKITTQDKVVAEQTKTDSTASNTTSVVSARNKHLIPENVLSEALTNLKSGATNYTLQNVQISLPKAWTTEIVDDSKNPYKRVSANAMAGVVSCTLSIEPMTAGSLDDYIKQFKDALALGLGISPDSITMTRDTTDTLSNQKCRRITLQFKSSGYPFTAELLSYLQADKAYTLTIAAPDEVIPQLKPTFKQIEKSVVVK